MTPFIVGDLKLNARLRQDAIVRSLRRTGSSTIANLAAQVGASRSTLLRDIRALRDQGFIIDSEPGRGGGLRLDLRSVQITPRLSVIEVFALLISAASMRAAGNLPFSNFADSGLEKIEKGLPPEKIRDLRRFLDCLYIGELAPQVNRTNVGLMDSSLLPEFEVAFLQRQHLRFNYCDASGRSSTRIVEPQAMLILPPLWYLVAWDPARHDFRHFRMDRISEPHSIEGTTFRKRTVAWPPAFASCGHDEILSKHTDSTLWPSLSSLQLQRSEVRPLCRRDEQTQE
ncbi:helix-turn-helix transcriptional regulator [Chitinimonas prasina]|uniref:helix-turn-helix transcriptional regulator n=1 Tax=Chitinimonas prasina TaxID=1434937 RepID=UPI0024E13ED0|nr:WYL domain-containing protein [Chitinimonas prasina]